MNDNRHLHREAHGDDGFRNAATVLGTLMILVGAPCGPIDRRRALGAERLTHGRDLE